VPAFSFADADDSTKRLLIVHHTQFGGTAQLATAALDGAGAVDDVSTIIERPAAASPRESLGA
jgi:hypothetical protein